MTRRYCWPLHSVSRLARCLASHFVRTAHGPFLLQTQRGCRKDVRVKPPPFAMTVDVEEWYTGVADSPDGMAAFESRLTVGLTTLLDLFDRTNTRATFFFLGYIAEQQPHWVAQCAHRGHEIGCHGLYHRPLWQTNSSEFKADISRARNALMAAGAGRVDGFRAPLFSLRRDTMWAHAVLEELGFEYSSSVFPIYNPRYGFPEAPRLPYLATSSGRFIEFPMSTLGFGPLRVPFSGGFYLRLLPKRVVDRSFALHGAQGRPGACYIQPWELDPEQPNLPTSFGAHLRHRLGLSSVRAKLEMILTNFRFAPMRDVLAPIASTLERWSPTPPRAR